MQWRIWLQRSARYLSILCEHTCLRACLGFNMTSRIALPFFPYRLSYTRANVTHTNVLLAFSKCLLSS